MHTDIEVTLNLFVEHSFSQQNVERLSVSIKCV